MTGQMVAIFLVGVLTGGVTVLLIWNGYLNREESRRKVDAGRALRFTARGR